jgi:hypothetical protein
MPLYTTEVRTRNGLCFVASAWIDCSEDDGFEDVEKPGVNGGNADVLLERVCSCLCIPSWHLFGQVFYEAAAVRDGCVLRRKKELLSPAVVPVVAGKVEMWRETATGARLRVGWVLENLSVELRASGKVDWEG